MTMSRRSDAREPQGIVAPGYRLPAATTVGRGAAPGQRSRPLGRRSTNACSACARSSVPPPRRRWRLHDGSPILVRLETAPGLRGIGRRGALGLFHFAILLPDRRGARPLRRPSGGDRHAGGDVGSPGERGDLPERSGRPRNRGIRRSSARDLGIRRRSAADGDRAARGRAISWPPAAGSPGPACRPARSWDTCTSMSATSPARRRSSIARSASTRWCGTTRERCSSRRAAITTTSAPTPGPPAIAAGGGSGAAAVVGPRAAGGGGRRRRDRQSRAQRIRGRSVTASTRGSATPGPPHSGSLRAITSTHRTVTQTKGS